MEQKSGERTLLASVVLSSPGPLVLGISLYFGRSSTQLADFIRRTAELVAIIVSWIVFRILHKASEPDTNSDPDAIDFDSDAASSKPNIANCESAVTTCESDISNCEPDVATCEPDIINCELNAAICEPDIARKGKLERIANLFVGAAMCLSGVAMIFIALFSSGTEKGNVIPGLVIAVLGVITNSWFWFRYSRLNQEKPNAILAAQSRLYSAKSLVDTCVTIALVFVAAAPAASATRYVDLGGSIIVAAYLLINGITTVRGKNIDT